MDAVTDHPPRVADLDALEPEIRELGARLVRRSSRVRRSPTRALQDRGMELTSRDPQLRAALFRLVDVAPATAGPQDLAAHLHAFLTEVERPIAPVRAATRATTVPAGRRAAGIAASLAVRQMAGRFIVGESARDALPELRRLWERGVATTVDLLGEATVTAEEGRRYADRCDETLVQLASAARAWTPNDLLERDEIGR